MALPAWINPIFSGISITITLMIIETYFYLKRYRNIICLVPEAIKQKLIVPIIGSSIFMGGAVLSLIYELTGLELLHDLRVIAFDFFLLTMAHFVYSLRKNIRMVSE